MQNVNNGRFQLKTKEDSEEFAFTQMKIENPKVTAEYLKMDWDPGCPSCVPETEKPAQKALECGNCGTCSYCKYDEDFLKDSAACDLENKEDCEACQ